MAFTKRIPKLVSYATNYAGDNATATWVDEPGNRFLGEGFSRFSTETVPLELMDDSTIEASANGSASYVHIHDAADNAWITGLETALQGATLVHIKETYDDGSALIIGAVAKGVTGSVRLADSAVLARIVAVSAGGGTSSDIYTIVPAV